MEFIPHPTNRFKRLLNRIPVLGDVVRRPLGALGSVIVLTLLVIVVFAPLLAPYNYATQDIPNRLQGPSESYLLGTDHLGRDLLSRLIYGARIALSVAVPAVALALAGGLLIGLTAGYIGGRFDNITLVVLDSIQAFPVVILALAMLAVLGSSHFNVIIVIGLAWIPHYARITRAQVLAIKESQFIEVERSLGATRGYILFHHIMPNIIAPLLILVFMDLPAVITFEAGLSFLGLGVKPPTPSWGVILSDGFTFIRNSPWPIAWAGLALIISTLGIALFGEALRDVLDPRVSGTRGD